MGWLEKVVDSFILTFGITQPRPENRRVATLFIGGLLLLVLLGLVFIAAFAIHTISR